MGLNSQKRGALLLIAGSLCLVVAFLVPWYNIPYTMGNATRYYSVRLIDILLNHYTLPPGASAPFITFAVVELIVLYLSSIFFFTLMALMAWMTDATLRWLMYVSIGYVILSLAFLVPEAMWMGLNALSSPYVGIQPTIYHVLIFANIVCVALGSYQISKPRTINQMR